MKNKARAFAIQAHGDQRYGGFPYAVHLDEVASIAQPYGELAQTVALLHDVIEDTDVTAQDIEGCFGGLVARCVQILSDEPGETRKIRKKVTYQKMSQISGEETLALLVKAADRLANMRACIRTEHERLLDVYRSEYDVFKAAAYRPDLCDNLWAELEAMQYVGEESQ